MGKQTIVINLFGGPGSGKSTTRADAFVEFKLAGINIEEIPEWVKFKVYEKNSYVFTDQIYIFAKQLKWLKQTLSQVDFIVTDSPIILSAIYDQENDPVFRQLVLNEFNKMKTINFFVNRVKPYNPVGRNQTEAEAKEIDALVFKFLEENKIPFIQIDGDSDINNRIAGRKVYDYTKLGMLWPQ